MKKWLWLLPIAAVLAFAACSMPGNVYMSFDYAAVPLDWNCTDPNIDTPVVADTLAPGFDYLTLPGDYYFEFQAPFNSLWYGRYYSLSAHKGAGSPGEDAIFVMYLPNPGTPLFGQVQGLAGSGSAATAPAAGSVVQSGNTFDKSNYQFKQLGQYSQTQGGYSLTTRYGVWEPKK